MRGRRTPSEPHRRGTVALQFFRRLQSFSKQRDSLSVHVEAVDDAALELRSVRLHVAVAIVVAAAIPAVRVAHELGDVGILSAVDAGDRQHAGRANGDEVVNDAHDEGSQEFGAVLAGERLRKVVRISCGY